MEIDETKIPMNFSWRAGIGTNKEYNQNTVNKQNNSLINKNELYLSVLNETLMIIYNFLKPNLNKVLSHTEMVIIKSSIRNKIVESLGRYFKYLETDFIPYLKNNISFKGTFYEMLGEDYIIDIFNSKINNQPMKDIIINE